MGGNSQRKISKRRKKSAELWDFYAAKVLLAVKPEDLWDTRKSLDILGIPVSKKTLERLRAALVRTGAIERGFRYYGSTTKVNTWQEYQRACMAKMLATRIP